MTSLKNVATPCRRAGALCAPAALPSALRPRSERALTVAVLALAALGACDRPSARGAEPEAPQQVSAAATPQSGAQLGAVQPASLQRDVPASDRFSESAFDVELRPVGAPVSGKPGQVEALIVAKAPYHVNAEYPLKFTLEPSPGVTFTKPVVRKESAKIEEMKATVPVEFVAQSAGKKRIAGLLAFSVCNDERCLLEKRQLALDVEVK